MFEKHLNEKQLAGIETRRSTLGPEGLLKAQESWTALKAEVRTAVANGVAPTSAEGKALGARWKTLVDSFTGGDAGTEAGLKHMYHHEAGLKKVTGNDDAMVDWINKAIGR